MSAVPSPPIPQLVFGTASEHVISSVPIATPLSRLGDIRKSLVGQRFDSVVEVVICEQGKLVGLANLEDVLAGGEDTLAHQIMDPNPPVVAPGTDQEVAAWQAVRHRESSLAVVDADGRFLGLIPAQRLLAVLLWEHDEDMARLGGFLRDTSTARATSEEPVVRRFLHRLPWLLVGLGGALAAAWIVGSFEKQLEGEVILAFFIPGVVYLADAVGTQTETLIIRGLSVGVPVSTVARRELLTGLFVGLALSVVFFPIALLWWGRADVALSVAIALMAASSIATLVAMSLPWLFHRLGKDPAFGSGPLATVIQDLLSIVLYFVISANIVQGGS